MLEMQSISPHFTLSQRLQVILMQVCSLRTTGLLARILRILTKLQQTYLEGALLEKVEKNHTLKKLAVKMEHAPLLIQYVF